MKLRIGPHNQFFWIATSAAVTGPQECVSDMREAYRRRRDLAIRYLRERAAFSYFPQGAFYLMVDVSYSGSDGEKFAPDLLEKRGVAVAPGPTFGPA